MIFFLGGGGGGIVPNWVYFGQGEDFKFITTELSEKVQYSRNQAIKNGLNEAILLMSVNEALLLGQNFLLLGNQDLILLKVI